MNNRHEKNQFLQLEEGVHDHYDEDHQNEVDNNCRRSEENDYYQPRLPMRMMNNNNEQKKKEKVTPGKYRSLKQILHLLDHHSNEGISRPPPPRPPSLSNSSASDQYSNGDGDGDDDNDGVRLPEETMKSSEIIDLARFSFKWGKTDVRGRESRSFLARFSFKWGKTDMRSRKSRIADRSREFSVDKAVVHEVAVGYKCGESLKELLYGMYKRAGVKVTTKETATTSTEASTSEGGKRKAALKHKNNDDITDATNPKMKKQKKMMN